jgi:hypothetical protein
LSAINSALPEEQRQDPEPQLSRGWPAAKRHEICFDTPRGTLIHQRLPRGPSCSEAVRRLL